MYQKLFENWRSYQEKPITESVMDYEEYGSNFEEFLNLLKEMSNKTWIFFDTETTGLSPDKPHSQITQVAAIAVDPKGFAADQEPEILDKLDARLNLANKTKDFMDWEQRKSPDFEREKKAKIAASRSAGVDVPVSDELKSQIGVTGVRRIKPPDKYSLYRPISANLAMTGYGSSPNPEKRRRKEFLNQVGANPDLKLADVDAPKITYYTGPRGMSLFKEFLDKYPDRIMVAQNAPFDDRFISAMNKRVGVETNSDKIFDTVSVFRKFLVPALKNFQERVKSGQELPPGDMAILKSLTSPSTGKLTVSLGKLIKAFDIKNKGWHNALADVLMLLDALKAVVNFIDSRSELRSLKPEPKAKPRAPRIAKSDIPPKPSDIE
jgi:DNA polymerase III epsilon subunit-like protein